MKNLAKEFIKKHEGFSASEYICPAGFRTIGYGRNVQSNPLSDSERALLVGGKISEKHAELLLEREIEKIHAQLSQKSFFSCLNTARGAVLIDMVYNIGMARFNGFKRNKVWHIWCFNPFHTIGIRFIFNLFIKGMV